MSDAVPVPEILTPDVDTPTEEPSLSAEINKTTRDLHDIVNVLIMNRLSSCLKSRDHTLYREGILSFYHVYRTFEHVWASLLLSSASTDPTVHYLLSTLSDPRMIRSPALAADCSYLFPENTFHPDAPVPENRPQVKEFVAHMQRVLEEKPHVMVAYAHMFYMALFAGGKVLRRMIVAKEGFFPVRKPAGDQEEARKMGTQMFMFPVEEGKGEELRKRFKEAVAIVEVGLDEDERADILEESKEIFRWNEKLIYELDEICAKIARPKEEIAQKTEVPQEPWIVQNKLPLGIGALVLLFAAKKTFWS